MEGMEIDFDSGEIHCDFFYIFLFFTAFTELNWPELHKQELHWMQCHRL